MPSVRRIWYGPASGQGANDAKLKENVLRACCSSRWCCVGDAVVVECGGILGRVTESYGCSWRVVWRLGSEVWSHRPPVALLALLEWSRVSGVVARLPH